MPAAATKTAHSEKEAVLYTSSKMSTFGFLTRARARAMRCLWPPDSSLSVTCTSVTSVETGAHAMNFGKSHKKTLCVCIVAHNRAWSTEGKFVAEQQKIPWFHSHLEAP
jgi:hypothetical protein